MAINFPTSPTVGDTVTSGDTTWIWTAGGTWDLVPVAGAGGGASLGDIFLLGGM